MYILYLYIKLKKTINYHYTYVMTILDFYNAYLLLYMKSKLIIQIQIGNMSLSFFHRTINLLITSCPLITVAFQQNTHDNHTNHNGNTKLRWHKNDNSQVHFSLTF